VGYEKDTDAGAGYGPYTNPGGGYPTTAAPTYLTTPTPKPPDPSKPPDFTYLSTIYDGTGKYHINHFVAYFDPSFFNFQGVTPIQHFYQNFCTIFSTRNVARAVPEVVRKFKGLDVVKFTIGGNIGDFMQQMFGKPHDDWVAMQMAKDGKSFYGTTLKREWFEPIDNVQMVSGGISPKFGPVIASMIVEANKRHFLAGRRSWRVEYDGSLKRCRVETAAFERSSHPLYEWIERTGLLRESIIELWTNLLENYPVVLHPVKAMKLVPTGYDVDVKGNVAYMMEEDESAQKVLSTPGFPEVLKRHPGLVTDL
jgi:hypothetical protein